MRNKVLKNIWLSILSVFIVTSVVYWALGWWEWVENAADGESLTHTVWNSLVDWVVKKTGSIAETITGIKTFSNSPIVPSPTASGEVTSKGYVDASITANANGSSFITSATYWWSRHRSMDSVYDRRQWNGNAINLMADVWNASHEKLNINITLYNPAIANSYGYVRAEGTAAHKDSWVTSWQSGWAQASASAFNAIRLYMNNWTMTSGSFKLYGIKYN